MFSNGIQIIYREMSSDSSAFLLFGMPSCSTQLRELDCKVVFALNMADQAQSRGIKIDAAKLSELLDLPVVFTVGNKGQGVDKLLKAATDLALSTDSAQQRRKVRYNQEIEKSIGVLSYNFV